MSGPEITFIVHPRPTSDDPKAIVDVKPALAARNIAPAPAEDRREWDTFRSNLSFLIRYAFGRH